MRTLAGGVCLSLAVSIAVLADIKKEKNQGREKVKSVHRVRGAKPKAPSSRKSSGNGISYHGGPVMLGTTNVYYIWYGNWTGNNATSLLTNLAATVGGSRYYNINTTYYDASNQRVSNSVHYGGYTTDNYSQGADLTDAGVQMVVADAIFSGRLPKDPHGVYFVLASKDVNEISGFCTAYCGWHSYGNIGGVEIKYSFVGDGARCPIACAPQTTSPNGNPGADGMASIIMHELAETVTDPLINAWYDDQGNESASKCAWTFGKTHTASNGSIYNITLGGVRYLVQQNWVNAKGGSCEMDY